MTETQRVIAENLRKLRADRGWTQDKLAKKAGITPTTVVHLETGRTWVRTTMITRLAQALKVHETELFRDPEAVSDPALPAALRVLNEALSRYSAITDKVPPDIVELLLDQDEFGFSKVRALLLGARRGKATGIQSTQLSLDGRKFRKK